MEALDDIDAVDDDHVPTRLEDVFSSINSTGWALALHDCGCCAECGYVTALHEATMAGKAAFVYHSREATYHALHSGHLQLHAGMCSSRANPAPIVDTLLAALQQAGMQVMHRSSSGSSGSFCIGIPAEELHFLADMHVGEEGWDEDGENEEEEGAGAQEDGEAGEGWQGMLEDEDQDEDQGGDVDLQVAAAA